MQLNDGDEQLAWTTQAGPKETTQVRQEGQDQRCVSGGLT